MNPLYNYVMSGNFQAPQPVQPMNPIQKMQQVMQAMQNPSAYLVQKFPDIPVYMRNDPNQIFQYLQQTRNITNGQIQQVMQEIPMQRR